MTVWSYSISWSKLRLALECPRQLQHTIDKKPHGRPLMGYHGHLGTLVQKTFELYFNQGINLKSSKPETISRAAKKVADRYFELTQVQLPPGEEGDAEATLRKDLEEQAGSGLEILRGMGLLNQRVRSEVKLNGTFRGFRMYAQVDFMTEGADGDCMYDGKASKEKNADPRQILYYALNRATAGKKIKEAGLIYWKHGFEPIDTSPATLRGFIDNEIAQARPIFELLRKGTGDTLLEAKPSAATCKFCYWRDTCEVSHYRKTQTSLYEKDEVGF